MQRALLMCLLVYAPHLVEEHVAGMWNDPVIVAGLAAVSGMPARQAAYLVFQIMLGLGLLTTYAWGLGDRSRRLVLAALAVALLAEAHHIVRALADHHYNAGLVTSLPMPFAGALVLYGLFQRPRSAAASP
jgi:hypothetical protein